MVGALDIDVQKTDVEVREKARNSGRVATVTCRSGYARFKARSACASIATSPIAEVRYTIR
ncbi:MAG: hypothetical protein V8Q35_06590 [Alistipes finegoldii]